MKRVARSNNKILVANELFCNHLNYEFEETKQKMAKEKAANHSMRRNDFKDILSKIADRYETELKTKSEDSLWMPNKTTFINNAKDIIDSFEIQTTIAKIKKAEDKLIKSNRIYSVLSYINQLIVRSNNQETLFNEACKITTVHGKFQLAWIGILDENTKKVSLVAENNAHPEDLKYLSEFTFDENGPTAKVLRSGTYYVINNFNYVSPQCKCEHYTKNHEFHSAIFLPIKKAGNTVGTFNLFSSDANFFDKEEISLLVEVSSDISFALDVFEKEEEKKLALEKLDHSESRLKEAQRIAHVGSWEYNIKTDKAICSDEACRIYGISEKKKTITFKSWLQFIHPEDREYVLNNIKSHSVLLKEFSFNHRILLNNGTEKYVYLKILFEFDGTGKPIGIHGTVQDVTAIKKAEEEIITLNEELENKVMQRTMELAKANVQLEQKAEMLMHASTVIEKKNRDITDSLNYAKVIQSATVNKEGILNKHFPDSFILNMPLHIVSGDFVRVDEKNGNVLVALADCTGHGVPGALMSMIGYSFFHDVIHYENKIIPSEVLYSVDENFKKLTTESLEMHDGMDVAFCTINVNTMQLHFAGAHRPLYIIRENALIEVKGDNLSIGGFEFERQEYTNNILQLQKNDAIYMFSDGYTDQFGGEKGKKFSSKRFKEMLISIQHLKMNEQHHVFKKTINEWKGNLEQIDDICVLGISV